MEIGGSVGGGGLDLRVLSSPGLVSPQNISGGKHGAASCGPGPVLPVSNHVTCEDGGGAEQRHLTHGNLASSGMRVFGVFCSSSRKGWYILARIVGEKNCNYPNCSNTVF